MEKLHEPDALRAEFDKLTLKDEQYRGQLAHLVGDGEQAAQRRQVRRQRPQPRHPFFARAEWGRGLHRRPF